jgi:hypothetical protein
VAAATRYEYRIYSKGTFNLDVADAATVVAGVNLPPIEQPGRVILLVDSTLKNQLANSINVLIEDLQSEGWTVLRHDVPRHVDAYGPNEFAQNEANVRTVIKPLITSDYVTDPVNTRTILIIGHVAIPYSGTIAQDGHNDPNPLHKDDHTGAWAADMVYGIVSGTWTDAATIDNQVYNESKNLPGDGKYDQNFPPLADAWQSDQVPLDFVNLAVGRIDFARLPIFDNSCGSTDCEVSLLQRYLAKNHNYRCKLLSWQQANNYRRAIVYSSFDPGDARGGPIFDNARQNAQNVFGDTSSAHLTVGDFFMQRTDSYNSAISYLLAFQAGAGLGDSISYGFGRLQHQTSDLISPANEPHGVFYFHLASWMGDWNLSTNNYLRALLTTSDYGLASMWLRYTHWRFDAPALGEPLGSAWLRMVNNPRNARGARGVWNLGKGDQSRELAILGDPTLSLEVVKPPYVQYDSNSRNLSWSSPEAEAYYVYYKSSLNGQYTRIYPTSNPISSPQRGYYMMKAIKTTVSGNGSYQNISRGSKIDLSNI